MVNFFYDDTFCSDLNELAYLFDIDEDNVNELKEDWSVMVELSNLEPIFEVDAEIICDLLADKNEERLGEYFEVKEDILKSLNESIDFGKLKALLPKFYYPANKFETITKSDLVEHFLYLTNPF